MMKKVHNCKEIVNKVTLLLDGELNKKEEQDVLCELQRCMHCLEEYNLGQRFKNFISTRILRKSMPNPCLDKIKKNIENID